MTNFCESYYIVHFDSIERNHLKESFVRQSDYTDCAVCFWFGTGLNYSFFVNQTDCTVYTDSLKQFNIFFFFFCELHVCFWFAIKNRFKRVFVHETKRLVFLPLFFNALYFNEKIHFNSHCCSMFLNQLCKIGCLVFTLLFNFTVKLNL